VRGFTCNDCPNLQDSIAAFAVGRNAAIRAKYVTTEPYFSTQRWNGADVILCSYLTNSNDTLLAATTNLAYYPWLNFFGPTFFFMKTGATGNNPGVVNNLALWYGATRDLRQEEFNGRRTGINVMHFGACKNVNRNLQQVTNIEDTIDWLEWIAGKDLYECVFSYELTKPKHWQQLAR